jgi:hypothetical protein
MSQKSAAKIIILALSLGSLGAGCAAPKAAFPGYLYVLADSNIVEITAQGATTIRSGVQTAAISPDGAYLLVVEGGKTLLVKTETNETKTLADRPARRLGWNADGSRFFFVSDPETNQLEIGDRLGNLTLLYRGPHRQAAAEGSEPATLYGEISGCLFLDEKTFVFSAYEGVISPTRTDQDLSANKAFMIDLASTEAGLRSTKFPDGEIWRFTAVDPQTGVLLVVVGNKQTGGIRPFLCPPFTEWEDLNFATPVPGTYFQSANGAFSVAFESGQGKACGLTVATDNRQRNKAVFTVYDDEAQTSETGPDAGWGDNIVGPAVHPDGTAAAALVYEEAKEWRVVFMDLEAGTSRTVWTRPAAKNGAANPNDSILIWLR